MKKDSFNTYNRQLTPCLIPYDVLMEYIEKNNGKPIVYVSLASTTLMLVKPRKEIKEVKTKFSGETLYYEMTLDIVTNNNEQQKPTNDFCLKVAITTKTPMVYKIPSTNNYAFSLGNSSYIIPYDIKTLKIFIKTIGVGRLTFGTVVTKHHFSKERLWRYNDLNNYIKSITKLVNNNEP